MKSVSWNLSRGICLGHELETLAQPVTFPDKEEAKRSRGALLTPRDLSQTSLSLLARASSTNHQVSIICADITHRIWLALEVCHVTREETRETLTTHWML